MFNDEYNNEEVNSNELNEEYNEYYDDNADYSQNSSPNKGKLWIVIGGIALVIIIIIFMVVGGGGSSPAPIIPELVISNEKETIAINNTVQLSAIVTNIENAILTWTSSDIEVATVDQLGLVKGIDYGTSVISATYIHTDNMPYAVTCEITVGNGDPNVKITSVKFPDGEVLISVGSEFDLPVIIEPADGFRTNVSYQSTDEGIVTVDKQGKIKAISVGQATISLDFNNGEFKDDIKVNVVAEQVTPQVFIPVESIEFTEKLVKMTIGETKQLNYNILPKEALTSTLKWESSNPSIATVNNGIVTAVAAGTADITITSLNGKSAIATVEVSKSASTPINPPSYQPSTPPVIVDPYIYATDIIVPSSISMKVLETTVISATVVPSNTDNKTLSFTSSNPSVASVSSSGVVTAYSEGTATITVSTVGSLTNNIVKPITVIVTKDSSGGSSGGSSSSEVTKISLSKSSVTIKKGSSTTVSVTVTPSGASVTLNAVTSPGSVASTSCSGKTCTITGVGKGSATVTIFPNNKSNLAQTVSVTVTEDSSSGGTTSGTTLTSLSIYPASATTIVGSTTRFSINKSPTSATNINISCSSSNSSVAAVSSSTSTSCLVTGKKAGSATITVRDSVSGKSASATVTVTADTSSGTGTDTTQYSCVTAISTACTASGKVGDNEYITCTPKTLYKYDYAYTCTFPAANKSYEWPVPYSTSALASANCTSQLNTVKASCLIGFTGSCGTPKPVSGYEKVTCTKK